MGDSFVGTPCHTFAIGDQDGNKQNYWWGGGDGLDGDGKQYFLVLKRRHELFLFEYSLIDSYRLNTPTKCNPLPMNLAVNKRGVISLAAPLVISLVGIHTAICIQDTNLQALVSFLCPSSSMTKRKLTKYGQKQAILMIFLADFFYCLAI